MGTGNDSVGTMVGNTASSFVVEVAGGNVATVVAIAAGKLAVIVVIVAAVAGCVVELQRPHSAGHSTWISSHELQR